MYAALCIQFLLYYSFSWCHLVIVSTISGEPVKPISSAVGECIVKTSSCIMQSALCWFHDQVVDPSSLPRTLFPSLTDYSLPQCTFSYVYHTISLAHHTISCAYSTISLVHHTISCAHHTISCAHHTISLVTAPPVHLLIMFIFTDHHTKWTSYARTE